MKNILLILILLAVVLGGFCVLSFQTARNVAVKVDKSTNDMFAVEQSVESLSDKVEEWYAKVEGVYDKAEEMVAEGYSEPDEEIKDKQKQPQKKGILSRLLNLFKR
jgi:peptidoglycan hydrolase CwlO-like protein